MLLVNFWAKIAYLGNQKDLKRPADKDKYLERKKKAKFSN